MPIGTSDGQQYPSNIDLELSSLPRGPLQGSQEATGALKSQEGREVAPQENSSPESSNWFDKDFSKGTKIGNALTQRTEEALKGLVTTAWNAIKAPGEAAQGKLPMWAMNEDGSVNTSSQVIEKVVDLAGLTTFAPAPIVSKAVDGSLGVFAGVKSKTLDLKSVNKAHELVGKGVVDKEDIFKQTGFFTGTDGRLRYEIPDKNAKIVKSPYESTLGEVLDHPELFKAYPHLKDVYTEIDPSLHPKGAYYDPKNNTIVFGKEASKDKSVMMHEIQHAIQEYEGFNKGGAPIEEKRMVLKFDKDVEELRSEYKTLYAKDKLTDEEVKRLNHIIKVFQRYPEYRTAGVAKSRENYMNLAGEVEARNVQTRSDYDPRKAKNLHPIWTEDTPKYQQVVKDKTVWATPYGYE